MAKLVSKTYGDALFDLALEENTIDQITEEVNCILSVLASNEELTKLFTHPKVSKQEKIKVIENVFKGRFSDTIVGFLVIIMEKGRYEEIDSIFSYYLGRVREHRNIGVAEVTSAIALSEEQRAKVEEKLLATTKYQQFEMKYTVDKSIIGGLIIRIGDRIVDSSIKNQLKNLTKALV